MILRCRPLSSFPAEFIAGSGRRSPFSAGWRALPPGEDEGRGEDLIREHGGISEAIRATHPDRGGDPDEFRAVIAVRDRGRA